MDAFLGKEYKQTHAENWDEFLKKLNVGLVTRKMSNTITPVISLKKSGDTYTFTSASTLKTTSFTFKVGEEFTEETADGRKVQSTCTFDGNKMIQVHKDAKGQVTNILREFSDNEVKVEMSVDGVVSKKVYTVQ